MNPLLRRGGMAVIGGFEDTLQAWLEVRDSRDPCAATAPGYGSDSRGSSQNSGVFILRLNPPVNGHLRRV